MAKQEFPMPKKPCRDVRARVLRLREQFVLMLKRQQENVTDNTTDGRTEKEDVQKSKEEKAY